MEFLPYIAGAAGLVLAVFFYRREQRNYRKIDLMLDEVLNESLLSQNDLKEGQLSVLSNKLLRIHDKMNIEISHAEQEREQVKGLISNMSHQLKTPLANIMMYQELLEDKSLPLDERIEFLHRLKVQSEKIDWILNSLFQMVKLEQNVIIFEPDNLPFKPTLTKAVCGVFAKAQKKNIRIVTEEFQDQILWHNEIWTAEALENILENAVKYTPEGGQIAINFQKYEMYSTISVADTGIGITKDEQSKIFHRFYRSPKVENMEGSGIGLYLSKLILEKEHGYITVDSNYKKGAKFTVYLQNCKHKNIHL